MSKKEYKIDVQTRKDEKNTELRDAGTIPAVLYGNKVKNQNLKMNSNEFEKIFNQTGTAGLIELNIDSKSKVHVVVKEIQKNYVKDTLLHVDFYQVDMKKKIEVEITLNFIGESSVVKTMGGVLAKNLDSIKIQCLPANLIESVDVDLSELKTFQDKIKVSDLKMPETVEVLTDGNSLIANVLEPKVVIEEEPEETKEEDGDEGDKEEKAKEGTEKTDDKKEEQK
jgi:large subunit ribosomal protein L25